MKEYLKKHINSFGRIQCNNISFSESYIEKLMIYLLKMMGWIKVTQNGKNVIRC